MINQRIGIYSYDPTRLIYLRKVIDKIDQRHYKIVPKLNKLFGIDNGKYN